MKISDSIYLIVFVDTRYSRDVGTEIHEYNVESGFAGLIRRKSFPVVETKPSATTHKFN